MTLSLISLVNIYKTSGIHLDVSVLSWFRAYLITVLSLRNNAHKNILSVVCRDDFNRCVLLSSPTYKTRARRQFDQNFKGLVCIVC